MARRLRQGRSRKTTKKNKNAKKKPLEEETEAKTSTENVKNEEGETVKSTEVVSTPESDMPVKDTRAMEHLEKESKKRKYEPDSADDSTSEENKKLKETKTEISSRKMAIRIERWNANQLSEELKKAFPDIQIAINPEKPRSKSFEVTVCSEDGTEILVWTGINKGPPRKLKFPDNNSLIEKIQGQLADGWW